MLNHVKVDFQTVDLIKPIEDLGKIQDLVQKLINYQGGDTMSLGNVAELSALLPDGLRELGIEAELTYESSKINYDLATEALSRNVKVGIGALVAAAIAAIVALYRMIKNRSFEKSGPQGMPPIGMATAKAYRKEVSKSAPVLSAQLERFRENMRYFRDVGTAVLDGQVHPKLFQDCVNLEQAAKPFFPGMAPPKMRKEDRNKVNNFLDEMVEMMVSGRMYYKEFVPFNFLFMTDEQWFPHTEFLERFFRFARKDGLIDTMLHNLAYVFDNIRYSPAHEKDPYGPDSEGMIKQAYEGIERCIDIEALSKAVKVNYNEAPPLVFMAIVEDLNDHVSALFGKDIFEQEGGRKNVEPVIEKGLKDFYHFITAESDNEVGYTWYNLEAMADQCLDIVKLSERDVIGGSGHASLLAQIESFYENIYKRYKQDMQNAHHNNKHYKFDLDKGYYERLNELNLIGQFVRYVLKMFSIFSRVIVAMTNFEDRLQKLKIDIDKLNKVMIKLNDHLEEIRNG